ncbi:tRNA pseudouridine(55) synthase TruB [Candidatus Woesebacteria bacterium RIFOXYB1_FULL_38_16]|uniref:tRNA pseudouridine synthase B n=1 Tax=Candidatus Woesebacteria bacterium RIFOXYB1_FULL_38_16 TaxID=1802538 RepID=A0A1F8CTD8_9BACT|nr:MAG: tRNA pseudouridine(55) synthase TruB [Candidatus Woesebacteria bacterium RIFOXYA1_FULL_38_9]OGM79079.1 MAG: tRNA pseudouridine(55) synthase TruB [Candidatus Woesebacteria bacterium RIFOXYB1_FULL_38_16]
MYLLIDKDKGLTSHDVVSGVRRITYEKKVGHGGTLDPNATGLLVVAVGRENTKTLGELISGSRKIYEAEIILGEERDSGDVEGAVLKKHEGKECSQEEVEGILTKFRGRIKQVPPSYSAIKIKGKKAYELARKGISFSLPEREVSIYKLDLVGFKYPKLVLLAEVSSGTYIRSLAVDIGRALGCGAYLSNLRRTKVGKYSIENAVKLSRLSESNWKEYLK